MHYYSKLSEPNDIPHWLVNLRSAKFVCSYDLFKNRRVSATDDLQSEYEILTICQYKRLFHGGFWLY